MVKLEKERAIGEARAIVRQPAKAHLLKVGHNHAELFSPRGFGGEDAKINEIKVCKLERQQLGQLIFVKRKGFEAVVCRRATIHLHNEKLFSVRLKVDAHRAQGAQQTGKTNTILHGKSGLEEKERVGSGSGTYSARQSAAT
eukprot:4096350-Pleurochrysis_carterae.AAC.1